MYKSFVLNLDHNNYVDPADGTACPADLIIKGLFETKIDESESLSTVIILNITDDLLNYIKNIWKAENLNVTPTYVADAKNVVIEFTSGSPK